MTTLALNPNGDQVRTDRHAGVYVLLVLAGVAALVYQLAWQRVLSEIFGGGIESVATLAATFMLAVGVGSLVGGWLSRRRAIPLLGVMAAIELTSGALGLASLQIFDSVGKTDSSLPASVTVTMGLAVVAVSALPMGASLPLLAGDLMRRRRHVGGAVGLVLCLNFLGAGAGCLVGLLLMFPFVTLLVGAQGPLYVAVAINAAVATGALVAHRRGRCDRAVAAGDAPAARLPRQPMLKFIPLLSLGAAGGFMALSYEIFFLRTLSYAAGSSAIAFAATASAFLLGLAMGARQAGANCAALTRDGAMRRAVGTLMKANLLGLLFLPLISHLGWLDRGLIAVAVLMVYVVARSWGALLPYLAELGIAADSQAGMRTAILCFANCVGAAAGAIFTGFVLIGGLGLVATGTALVAAGLACALLLVSALTMPRPEKILRVSLAVALGLLAMVTIPRSNALDRLQWISASEAEPLAPAVEESGGR
jgi:spermidine synthase